VISVAKEKTLTCINCPLGCQLSVKIDGDKIEVSGFSCPRGEKYAKEEVLHPVRVITSTIPVVNGEVPMVSIKTKGEIPKDKIMECMISLKGLKAKAPVHEGDVILANVCNTGVDIIATKEVKAI